MKALSEMALGFMLGFALFAVLLVACGVVPVTAQCQLDAIEQLPLHDPESISVRDARQLAERLKACNAGDAGQ